MSPLLWWRTAIAAAAMAGGTLLVYRLALDGGRSIDEARTIALTTMVLFQAMHAGNARSEERSVLRMSPFGNPFLLLGTVGALLLHALVMYVPFTADALHLEPLELWLWPAMAAVALSVVAAVELHKVVQRRRSATP